MSGRLASDLRTLSKVAAVALVGCASTTTPVETTRKARAPAPLREFLDAQCWKPLEERLGPPPPASGLPLEAGKGDYRVPDGSSGGTAAIAGALALAGAVGSDADARYRQRREEARKEQRAAASEDGRNAHMLYVKCSRAERAALAVDCDQGVAMSCWLLSMMLEYGVAGDHDLEGARIRRRAACGGGEERACPASQ